MLKLSTGSFHNVFRWVMHSFREVGHMILVNRQICWADWRIWFFRWQLLCWATFGIMRIWSVTDCWKKLEKTMFYWQRQKECHEKEYCSVTVWKILCHRSSVWWQFHFSMWSKGRISWKWYFPIRESERFLLKVQNIMTIICWWCFAYLPVFLLLQEMWSDSLSVNGSIQE